MRKSSFLSICLGGTLILSAKAFAVCPVCTIFVGAGIGLSHWLGIDDSVTGLWIGGFIVSLIIWTVAWFDKKNIRFKGRKILITLLYYASVVVPLYTSGIIGHPLNKLWGIDKLVLGILLGSIAFSLGALGHQMLKARNNNHAFFPFQKVVMPILPLLVLSVFFYFLTW
ncbi:MAG: hypothetical protein ABIH77_04870 [Pseudomonadota bacterium]|nr:hypothetical protein [Gammaproteobacteria bacterium]MBU1558747.1 hypothetical protein [Gammaproteobacteria bacterium]MBU1629133.1 hypothetical protein [Gammaproteobacteria bacterium]MBU1926648.1 hypothetical protein [Gammaproteobacteria bacterium]MBU2546646.1 hypothetical protein [Gammaproteobacteria bacterium]